MAFVATITSVTLDRTNIKVVVTFTQGTISLPKNFIYDVKEDITLTKILDHIISYRVMLDDKTSLFQALKSREGTTV